MNLKTFKGPTMIECLSRVKDEMGVNAVILHTRTISKRVWLGMRRREVVEITAGQGIHVPNRAPRPQQIMPQQQPPMMMPSVGPKNLPPSQLTTYLGANGVKAVPISAAPVLAAPLMNALPGQQLLQTPAAAHIVGLKVAADVEELKKLVGGLVDKIQKKDAPQVPEELFNYYLKLVENHVAEELAGEIVRSLRLQLRPDQLNNDAIVREKLAELIEKMIPTTGAICRKKLDGPHIVALVGPTGVGKTTTLAKLAATLSLQEHRRVGMITLDTYRIAAVEQLRKYAEILRVNLRVVTNGDDLQGAIDAMRDCEFILIDTAGRSPRDTMKINELKMFLDVIQPDEIHLVLSSTASEDCVDFAIERFTSVNFDKVIFTKLDEATHVGTLLNVIKKVNKSLSYVTTGQDVPSDIEVGHGKKLAQWILGGEII